MPGGSVGSSVAGDGSDVVDSGHAYVVAGVRGVHDGVVADVHAHVVQVAEPEDQIARFEIGAAYRCGVFPLPFGVVAQIDADGGPGGEGEAGAVVAVGPGVGEDVGLTDEAARFGSCSSAGIAGVGGGARSGAQLAASTTTG